MTTASVFKSGGSQAVRLPKRFRVSGQKVAIRKEGEAIILEPIKPSKWPKSFWKSIRISDDDFGRPEQGEMQVREPLAKGR